MGFNSVFKGLNNVRVVKKQNNLDNFIYYQPIAEVNLCHIIISPIRFGYRYQPSSMNDGWYL